MKIRTEMWVLTRNSRPVRDEWGAYVMAAKLIDAEALAYKRGQEEVPKKFVLRLERI